MAGTRVFGVDLGGTTAKIGMFTGEGEKLDLWEIKTHTDNGGESILPDIAEAIKAKMAENGLTKEDVIGIGIGVPGPVDANGVVYRAVNLGWGVFNLKETMEKLMDGIRVEGNNDANVAALGEVWKGGGQGCEDAIVVTLGTGVGGGIISGGKLLTGANGGAGEIGHIHVEDDETEACNCGNYGCFEEYASATGAVRLAKRILAENNDDTPLRGMENFPCKDVFDLAKDGDPVACRIAERYGYYLGKGLAVCATMVNPKVIVLGGGVSRAGSILIDLLKDSFGKYVFRGCRDVEFKLATLGNDAGMYGAIKLVLD